MHKYVNTINLDSKKTTNFLTTISYHSIQLADSLMPLGFARSSDYNYYAMEEVKTIEYNKNVYKENLFQNKVYLS